VKRAAPTIALSAAGLTWLLHAQGVIDTRYGPVQVEVLLAGNRINDVRVLQYPNEARRSQEINAQALPLLHEEALSAQSANIDTISGATYTTLGYEQSLQAALEQAGIVTQ